jgi:hypothetical protein
MPRPVSIETPEPERANFAQIIDRVFVFDNFFSSTQLLLLERWALETPHWMLNNSVVGVDGKAQHRIWGASYINAWKKGGWPAVPPTLFGAVGTLFHRLGVVITDVQYIGLNGQLRGQDASMHTDCTLDAPDQLSILIYIGEDTDGDLLLFDKEDQQTSLEQISFRPNRIVAFDGSIPHRALAPTNNSFRMSGIVRGAYRFERAVPASTKTQEAEQQFGTQV